MRGADESFTCGLLHDIGQLIFLRALGPVYERLLDACEDDSDASKIEMAEFGFDHTELGAAAAAAWNLPSAVCSVIRWHHEPKLATEAVAMTTLIHLADELVCRKMNNNELGDLALSDACLAFGFSDFQLDTIWDTVDQKVHAVTHLL